MVAALDALLVCLRLDVDRHVLALIGLASSGAGRQGRLYSVAKSSLTSRSRPGEQASRLRACASLTRLSSVGVCGFGFPSDAARKTVGLEERACRLSSEFGGDDAARREFHTRHRVRRGGPSRVRGHRRGCEAVLATDRGARTAAPSPSGDQVRRRVRRWFQRGERWTAIPRLWRRARRVLCRALLDRACRDRRRYPRSFAGARSGRYPSVFPGRRVEPAASCTSASRAATQREGLASRLRSHASGRRSGDQFCVYVADHYVLPELTREQVEAIRDSRLSMDMLVREKIHAAFGSGSSWSTTTGRR